MEQQLDTVMSDFGDLAADPVARLLLTGQARSVDEAEEMYLDASLPEFFALLATDISDDDLGRHPLTRLLLSRGSRPREDSIL
jgi:hypothetical protein